jgi:hypothetical protein
MRNMVCFRTYLLCVILTANLGHSLRKSYKAAVSNRNLQFEAHRGFSEGIPNDLRAEWELKCKRWEEAPYPKIKHVNNPYEQAELCELYSRLCTVALSHTMKTFQSSKF